MTLEPRAVPVAELLDLVRHWLVLREQELPLLRRLEAVLESALEEQRTSALRPQAISEVSRQEELLRDLLRSFGPAVGGVNPAEPEAVGDVPQVIEDRGDPSVPAEAPAAPEQGVVIPDPPSAERSEFYLLVNQGDGWIAFPWERITRVVASESPEASPYEICYRVDDEERSLRVTEVGRIVAGAAADLAAPLGRFRFDSELEPAGPLTGLPEVAPGAPVERVEVEDIAKKEVTVAPPDEEPLAPITLRHVLSIEVDALECGVETEATGRGANGVGHGQPAGPSSEADTAAVALLAVRYLPARVALARALRAHGWQVVEEPDPAELRHRTTALRPGLICVELPDPGEFPGTGTEQIGLLRTAGCPVYAVASRHRVDDGRIPAEIPRLLHPFTEAELDALPAASSRSRA